MKKGLKRLTLGRETVRRLDALRLDEAVAGLDTNRQCMPLTAGSCNVTCENCPGTGFLPVAPSVD